MAILAYLLAVIFTESVMPHPVIAQAATVRKLTKFDGHPDRI